MSPDETASVATSGLARAEPESTGVLDAGAAGGGPWDVPFRPLRRFVDNHGPVIDRVTVWLVFWGTAWTKTPPPDPTPADVAGDVALILHSPYLSRLNQYRGTLEYESRFDEGTLGGSITVDAATGSGSTQSPADPPANFGDDDVAKLVTNLITSIPPRLPDPDSDPNLLYVVIAPSDPSLGNSANGEHYTRTVPPYKAQAHMAWVKWGTDPRLLTAIFSHELVEAITDPEGTAIVGAQGTCGNRAGWCEIGDVCENNFVTLPNGVTVQAYWSDADHACIVPTSFPRSLDAPFARRVTDLIQLWLAIHGGDPPPDARDQAVRDAATLRLIEVLGRSLPGGESKQLRAALRPIADRIARELGREVAHSLSDGQEP